MAVWRQLAGNFPRIAVMLHDLVMVWACWQLLHVARYAMLEGAPVIPLISFDLVIVMLLQAMAFHYEIGRAHV